MIHAFLTTVSSGLKPAPAGASCPHCGRAVELSSATRFVGIAVCPHPACSRRVVVDVLGRDVDGRPLEFRVTTPHRYVAAVKPEAGHRERRWLPAAFLMATATGCVALADVVRLLLRGQVAPLELVGLAGLVFLATASWTALAMGTLADRLVRAFLWRRGVVTEEPSAVLTDGTGVRGLPRQV